ncbi:MAG: asparaginase domain-containing protein [Thiotrichaceae bacterium]
MKPISQSAITVLLTGGTIDKHYNEVNGELDFTETHIPELLSLGRNLTDIELTHVMLKDSLELTDDDRQAILFACQHTTNDKVVITHGTDTMVDTAQVLLSNDLSKTVVLLGAMVPFVFKHSDAMFNMGFAMAAVQTLPHGIYIAMNGKIFKGDEVVKNRAKGQFEEK